MQVLVNDSAASAAEAAAVAIAQALNSAIGKRSVASLALSGGESPLPMVQHLASLAVAWDRVHLWQVDERAVAADDPDRNWRSFAALSALLPDSHRHPMPVEQTDAAERYSDQLHRVIGLPPVLDVVHLGMGSDGHTASLVPGSPVLDVADRDVSWVEEYQGHRRLTLTRPVLRAARCQVWLVVGADKADAVTELIGGEGNSPASAVAAGADASMFLDAAAAS